MYVQLENIVKKYDENNAVDNLSLSIEEGEFLVLLGPSGCGKTTTMRSLVGLEEPTSGRITVGGTVMFDRDRGINVPPNRRGMGMVFQSYAIWPHKTVFKNVSYPLEMQHVSTNEIKRRVGEMLEIVGLSGLGDRGASQLSGGQMQRVALARSLVMRPKVLLLDEPLSNLDAKLRDKLRLELREIQQELGTTSVYVTHDQSEALALADRIAIMRDGKIVQLEPPETIYKYPANTFVADFLGASNLFRGTIEYNNSSASTVTIADTGLQLQVEKDSITSPVGTATYMSIRPEDAQLIAPDTTPVSSTLPATIKVSSFMGTHTRYRINLENGPDMDIVSYDTQNRFNPGDKALVSIAPSAVQLLPE